MIWATRSSRWHGALQTKLFRNQDTVHSTSSTLLFKHLCWNGHAKSQRVLWTTLVSKQQPWLPRLSHFKISRLELTYSRSFLKRYRQTASVSMFCTKRRNFAWFVRLQSTIKLMGWWVLTCCLKINVNLWKSRFHSVYMWRYPLVMRISYRKMTSSFQNPS